MKVRYYSIKDVKANFGSLYSYVNDEVAKRNYKLALTDTQPNLINQCPEDYELFYVGSFDDSNGRFEFPENPEFICNAATFGVGG